MYIGGSYNINPSLCGIEINYRHQKEINYLHQRERLFIITNKG